MVDKEDLDLKFDENGNVKLTDPEKTMEQIRKILLDQFDSYIGQTIQSEETNKETLKKSIASVLDQSGLVESHHPISVKTRWQNMGWKGRLEWRLMKAFFPNRVREMQQIVNIHNSLVCVIIVQNELAKEAGLESELPPYETRDYPNWCHPNPKSVYDIATTTKLYQPIEYITMNIKV